MRDERLFTLCLAFMEDFYACKEIGENYNDRKYDFNFYLFEIENICDNTPSYRELKKYMNENEIIYKHIKNMIGLWSYRVTIKEWGYIKYFINNQSKYNKGLFIFDKDKFSEDYIKFENFFYNDKFIMRIGIRLVNFISNQDEIIISDNIKIVKIKEEDYDDIVYGGIRSNVSEYLVQLIYEEEKGLGDLNKEKAQEGYKRQEERYTLLNRFINVLRLYKSGNLKTGESFSRLCDPIITLGHGTGLVTPIGVYFNSYELKPEEIGEVIELWNQIQSSKIESYKEFTLALRRIGYAMDRNRFDDKLVDLVISYESLFLKKGEQSELVYRISLRVSKLLESDYKLRLKVKKEIKNIYSLRSKIVHGVEYSVNNDAVSKCEDYLRRSMKIYLIHRNEMSHDNILDRLDFSEIS